MGKRPFDNLFAEKNFSEGSLSKRFGNRLVSHLFVSVLTIIGCLGLYSFQMHPLKGVITDTLLRTQWWRSPHPDIKVVVFDDFSNESYGSTLRIPPDLLERLIASLRVANPKMLAVIGPISEKNYSEKEFNQISAQLSQIENNFIGYTEDSALGKPTPLGISPRVNYLPGFVSRDTLSYGSDSVTRRVMLEIEAIPTIYAKMAKLYHPPGTKLTGVNPSKYYPNSFQAFIHWQGGPNTYRLYSAADVVDGKISPEEFKDKIVLVGMALSSRKDLDYIYTPFSRNPRETTLIEGAAHSLGTLLNNNAIWKYPKWLEYAFCLSLGLITANLALLLSPIPGILLVFGEISALVVGAWVSLVFFGGWINVSHSLVLISLSYYMIVPYRLLQEYQRRWHYQEKSEFMTQLELLKSNFLSLVTHDLKTPIARIQGTTDLLLAKASQFKEEDRNRLKSIMETTEDMSEYVETILDLTRIESSKMPVMKTTKDINDTIQEVVQSKQKFAEEKEIRLVTHLDPLFSIKYDVKLIRRVIANLVENAVKYSQPGSEVLLSSSEKDNWICVSVSDKGAGIPSNEQEKVFQKFYRVPDQPSGVKGTGLGLYLVKYFVELHRGKVTLASQVGQGSTFSILLPISA